MNEVAIFKSKSDSKTFNFHEIFLPKYYGITLITNILKIKGRLCLLFENNNSFQVCIVFTMTITFVISK